MCGWRRLIGRQRRRQRSAIALGRSILQLPFLVLTDLFGADRVRSLYYPEAALITRKQHCD